MRQKVFLLLLVCTLCAGSSKGDQALDPLSVNEMDMVVGGHRVLDARQIESFSEGRTGIVDVKVPRDGTRLVISALNPGTTSILLIMRGGRQASVTVNVFARPPDTVSGEIRELIGSSRSLEVRRVGSRFYIRGMVNSERELEKVDRISALYGDQVTSLVVIDPDIVEKRVNVRIDLHFVELSRRNSYTAGMHWPGQIGQTQQMNVDYDISGGSVGATYQVVGQALPYLDMMASSGWAKVRRHSTLITTSGVKAMYSTGGEVNVAVEGSLAAEIRSIAYGAVLSVLPRVDVEQGMADLEVEAEVSDLTDAVNGVPGRTVSRLSTIVCFELGQSILLGGLDHESRSHSTGKVPFFGDIPLIGYLFRSESGRDQETEGQILITTSVFESIETNARRLIEKAVKRYRDFEGFFEKDTD